MNTLKKAYRSLLSNKLVVSLVLVLGLVGFLGYYRYHTSHSPSTIVTAGTPVGGSNSTPTTSQPTQKDNSATSAGSSNAGGATDTNGSATSSTNPDQWVTSASGIITVKQPVANAQISDGAILSGSAKVSEINYRLSDNKVGVIAQGTLSVVNGNFSGTLHFSPEGTGGRLDVFSTNEMGVEYNEVQINASF